MKLNVKAAAKALGLVWGLILMFMTISACFGWQTDTINTLKSSYVGVEATIIGAVIAFAWGFVSGAITGGLFAYFYNRMLSKK